MSKKSDRIEYQAENLTAAKVVLKRAKFTCTKCGKTKAGSAFGLRKMADGTVRNQAQCISCR